MGILGAALAIFLALAVFLVESDALAQARMPGTGCQGRFDKLDLNGDGTVTFEEFDSVPHPEGRAEWLFNIRDRNKDGKLTKQEFCIGQGTKKKGKGKETAQEPAKNP